MMTVLEQRTMESLIDLNRKIPDVTLRDLFAMSVIQTMNPDLSDYDYEIEDKVDYCYKVADIMLKVRSKK